MRKSIFEILKEKTPSIADEIIKIERLLRMGQHNYTLVDLINRHFIKWEHRGTNTQLSEIINELDLPNYKSCKFNNNFSFYQDLTCFDMFNYFELIASLLKFLADNHSTQLETWLLTNYVETIIENISTVLEKFGYEMQNSGDQIIIVKISEEATAVAENYEDIAEDVIEYQRHSMQGNLKRKRELLYNLSNRYEEIKANLQANCQSLLVNDIGTILNGLNIRHNNKNSEYVGDLTDIELEDWYDKAYDTLLLAFMQNRYLTIKRDIKSLRITLKSNNRITQ